MIYWYHNFGLNSLVNPIKVTAITTKLCRREIRLSVLQQLNVKLLPSVKKLKFICDKMSRQKGLILIQLQNSWCKRSNFALTKNELAVT